MTLGNCTGTHDAHAFDDSAELADARAVADCVINHHDGGASASQVAGALGWSATRLDAAVAWMLTRDLLSVTAGGGDVELCYLRQTSKTHSLLDAG